MEDNLKYDEINEYRLLLLNDLKLQSEPNTTVDYETSNCSTSYYNSQNLSNPSNDDLQNQTESFVFVPDDDMNPGIHYDGVVLNCNLCMKNNANYFCIGSKDIIKHLWEIHQEKLYICNVCKEQFHHKFELSKHTKIHVPSNSNKKWECGICTKKFGSKNLLDEHEYAHAGVQLYECDICNKRYTSKYTCKIHRKTHEPRNRDYKCEICERLFLTKQNLKQHEKTHKTKKEYFCNFCDDRTFTTENNLKSHMIIHEENKRFLCTFTVDGNPCGKKFSRKAELRDHKRIHTGERPFICTTCGASFAQRSNLQSHIKATHLNLKDKMCDICGKGFKRKRLLIYHMNAAHTKERPHKCDECGKDFVYPEHLKKHKLNLHKNEKPFQCNICNKNFSSRDNYNSHLYTHATRKQYECYTCGVGFTRKPTLKKHMDLEKHLGTTFILNRAEMQISSETSWEVITVSEIREIENITDGNAQTIPINGIVYENYEYANQYYSNGENSNEAYTIVQTPDGSHYIEIENDQIPEDDYANYIEPSSIDPNEYGNNEIINPTNMYQNVTDQNTLQQIEIRRDNKVKYVLMEFVPD